MLLDILHGIERRDVPLVTALEFAVLLQFDGQLKQNSKMERELFDSTMDQLKKIEMSKIENALVWLYFKRWGLKAQHSLDDEDLWIFTQKDFEEAITTVAFPRLEDKTERTKELKDLIMGTFEKQSLAEFRKWSGDVHSEVSLDVIMESVDI